MCVCLEAWKIWLFLVLNAIGACIFFAIVVATLWFAELGLDGRNPYHVLVWPGFWVVHFVVALSVVAFVASLYNVTYAALLLLKNLPCCQTPRYLLMDEVARLFMKREVVSTEERSESTETRTKEKSEEVFSYVEGEKAGESFIYAEGRKRSPRVLKKTEAADAEAAKEGKVERRVFWYSEGEPPGESLDFEHGQTPREALSYAEGKKPDRDDFFLFFEDSA